MTELRQRMLNAMVQRGFAARTQETYISAIRRMAKHFRVRRGCRFRIVPQ